MPGKLRRLHALLFVSFNTIALIGSFEILTAAIWAIPKKEGCWDVRLRRIW